MINAVSSLETSVTIHQTIRTTPQETGIYAIVAVSQMSPLIKHVYKYALKIPTDLMTIRRSDTGTILL
jgi:hypothetical protein